VFYPVRRRTTGSIHGAVATKVATAFFHVPAQDPGAAPRPVKGAVVPVVRRVTAAFAGRQNGI